jgi:hypothetical protein
MIALHKELRGLRRKIADQEASDGKLVLRVVLVMAEFGLCHMAMEDPEMTAEEHEDLLEKDPEFAEAHVGRDMHDYGQGLEPRRK